MDLTPDHSPTDAILVLSRGDAWLQVSWRPVHRLIEVQGGDDQVVDDPVQARAGHLFNEVAEGDQAQVAVAEDRSGRIQHRRGQDSPNPRRRRGL